jgi:hypothetical protein
LRHTEENVNGGNEQSLIHFLSPNPFEDGVPRPTWENPINRSKLWAKSVASSHDSSLVAPHAIPWLLLQVVGTQPGSSHGSTFPAKTSFVQRINTAGGIAPSADCGHANDGAIAHVRYTAEYMFYTPRDK